MPKIYVLAFVCYHHTHVHTYILTAGDEKQQSPNQKADDDDGRLPANDNDTTKKKNDGNRTARSILSKMNSYGGKTSTSSVDHGGGGGGSQEAQRTTRRSKSNETKPRRRLIPWIILKRRRVVFLIAVPCLVYYLVQQTTILFTVKQHHQDQEIIFMDDEPPKTSFRPFLARRRESNNSVEEEILTRKTEPNNDDNNMIFNNKNKNSNRHSEISPPPQKYYTIDNPARTRTTTTTTKSGMILDFAVAGFNKCGTTFLLSCIFAQAPDDIIFMGGIDGEIHLLERSSTVISTTRTRTTKYDGTKKNIHNNNEEEGEEETIPADIQRFVKLYQKNFRPTNDTATKMMTSQKLDSNGYSSNFSSSVSTGPKRTREKVVTRYPCNNIMFLDNAPLPQKTKTATEETTVSKEPRRIGLNGFKSPKLFMSEIALSNLETYFVPTSISAASFSSRATTTTEQPSSSSPTTSKEYTDKSSTSLGSSSPGPLPKFIITLRHPVWRFQSWYNFNVYKHFDRVQKFFPPPEATVGLCGELCGKIHPSSLSAETNSTYATLSCVANSIKTGCTGEANYHYYLSRLGLTPLNTEEEWEYLDHHTLSIHRKLGRGYESNTTESTSPFSSSSGDVATTPSNRLFLIELSQLDKISANTFVVADPPSSGKSVRNLTIANQVLTDMEEFLDVPYATLPRIITTGDNDNDNNNMTQRNDDQNNKDNAAAGRVKQHEGTDKDKDNDKSENLSRSTATTTTTIMNIISESSKFSFVQERLIDICDPKYDSMRLELIESGRKASGWIERYLLRHYHHYDDDDDDKEQDSGKYRMQSYDDRTITSTAPNLTTARRKPVPVLPESPRPLPPVIVSQPQDFLKRIRQWSIDPCR